MFFACYQTRYQSDAHSYDGAGGSFFVDAVGSTSLSYLIFPNISKYGTATNPKYDPPVNKLVPQIAEALKTWGLRGGGASLGPARGFGYGQHKSTDIGSSLNKSKVIMGVW